VRVAKSRSSSARHRQISALWNGSAMPRKQAPNRECSRLARHAMSGAGIPDFFRYSRFLNEALGRLGAAASDLRTPIAPTNESFSFESQNFSCDLHDASY
jgi:hypothetical protein